MSTAIQIKIDELNKLAPTKVVDHPQVEQKFVQMYNAMWGNEVGEQIYAREKFNFNKLLQEKPELQECSRLSLFGCFLDMAVNGLSLDQTGRPQCYMMSRNVKVKNGNVESWEKRANIQVSAYGEVYMRQRAGQIKYCDQPVIVYEGDVFSVGLDNGVKKITYQAAIPRKSNKIIAAFIRIVRTDNSEDYHWMMENDWTRLAGYSDKNNKGKGANALYTSNGGQIDPGFLENKLTKHAFDVYPKVRVGNFTSLATIEEPEQKIDYGIEETEAEVVESNSFDEAEAVEVQAVQPIVTQADNDEGF
jgi:recombinational DNA repair protein RecT